MSRTWICQLCKIEIPLFEDRDEQHAETCPRRTQHLHPTLANNPTGITREEREHAEEAAKQSGLPDSGARTTYPTGAIREADPDKPAVEGISPFAIQRLGILFAKGGRKYGDFRNWEKGIPVTRYIGGIIRHVFQYLARDTAEDHLAAIMWNAQCLIHHETVGGVGGKTFAELDDRPKWVKTIETSNLMPYPCCEGVRRLESTPMDPTTLRGGWCPIHGLTVHRRPPTICPGCNQTVERLVEPLVDGVLWKVCIDCEMARADVRHDAAMSYPSICSYKFKTGAICAKPQGHLGEAAHATKENCAAARGEPPPGQTWCKRCELIHGALSCGCPCEGSGPCHKDCGCPCLPTCWCWRVEGHDARVNYKAPEVPKPCATPGCSLHVGPGAIYCVIHSPSGSRCWTCGRGATRQTLSGYTYCDEHAKGSGEAMKA